MAKQLKKAEPDPAPKKYRVRLHGLALIYIAPSGMPRWGELRQALEVSHDTARSMAEAARGKTSRHLRGSIEVEPVP